jgi:ribosomal protein S18 acetylase RimI-like enzyme
MPPVPGFAYATCVHRGSELHELGAGQFAAELDGCVEIYAAAMGALPAQLPGRRAIMEQHTRYPAFRAITVLAGAQEQGAERPAGAEPGTRGPPDSRQPGSRAHAPGQRLVGFAYGFHGEPGQWWHDLVRYALTATHGSPVAEAWTADSFEIAEVHVHPEYQAHGIGHAMMLRLAAGRPESTSLLSTPDADTRARRLYHRLGFTDLLTGFCFTGTAPPYAVMGTLLPLRAETPGGGSAP